MEEKRISMGGGKTEVSLSENTNEVDITGVNVVTKSPKIGDIVCYDENRKVKFIALDTFHAGTFPAAWETVGVVVLRKGNKVTICSKNNEAKKFMEVYPYIVSGYTLDGVEHTAQLRLHGKPTTDTYYEFKYTASTDSEFVNQLKQFLTDNGETDWSAYLMDGKVYLQYDNYESPEYYTSAITYAIGLTLTGKITVDQPISQYQVLRKCGTMGMGVWHVERAKAGFLPDNSLVGYNPNEDISSIPPYPVCWPAFAGTSQYQEDHCLWLRQKYCKDPDNPTVEEWEKYIEDLQMVFPCMTHGQSPKFRDGKVFSDMLKNVVCRAKDGTRKPLYVSVVYCSKFFDGKGYMPSFNEFVEAFSGLQYGLSGVTKEKSDAVNRSLYAIGGNAVSSGMSWWSCIRQTSYVAAIASGVGCLSNSSCYTILQALPFARIELPLE